MRMRRLGRVVAGTLFLLVGLSPAFGEVAVPPLKARVTDLTGTLTEPQVQTLETRLRDFERAKGSQIAVLVLPTTQPETIEQYSIRVAEAWKIGRARAGDGVILIVAKNDRSLRVEVGRGLEGAIPDAIAKRIVSDVIAPNFRAGDFYGGLVAGTGSLMKTIEGEPLPAPRAQDTPRSGERDYGNLFVLLLVGLFFLGGVLPRLLGRPLGAAAAGGIAGFAAWIVAGLGTAIFIGIFAFIFTLIVSARGYVPGRPGGGGWSSGGWTGGGGDFGGGGGFSGGGGDFGGGGASGRW